MKKIILTDVDGVLTNWNQGFEEFALAKGFSVINKNSYYLDERFGLNRETAESLRSEFCNSHRLKSLNPLKKSEIYVNKIYKEFEYRFVCITKIGRAKHIQDNRTNNLIGIFGTAIQDIICIDSTESKRESLFKFAGNPYVWVEDHVGNAQLGGAFGFKTFLMDHEYNKTNKDIGFTRINDWEDIYKYIKNLEESPPAQIH